MSIDVTSQRAARDRRQIGQQILGVRERRGRSGVDARARVVLVTHHHVAVRREVHADVVVPLVIVAVPVADDDQRQLTQIRDIGRVIEVLAEERAAAVEHFCDCLHSRERRRVEQPQARLGAAAVDEVARGQGAAAVRVDDDIEREPQSERQLTREETDIQDEAIRGDPSADECDRLGRAADVDECRRSGPTGGVLVVAQPHVCRHTDPLRMPVRVEGGSDREVPEEGLDELEVGRARQVAAGEFESNEARDPSGTAGHGTGGRRVDHGLCRGHGRETEESETEDSARDDPRCTMHSNEVTT